MYPSSFRGRRVAGQLSVCVAFGLLASVDPAAAQTGRDKLASTPHLPRVYIYDLAGAGLALPLAAFSPWSAACTECARQRDPTAADLCNFGFGSPIDTPLSTAHQGLVWSNKGRGESLALQMHYRLSQSLLRTDQAAHADLFFIPLYIPQLCMPEAYTRFARCGIDFAAVSNFTAVWRWLLQQPSLKHSNGSDHFLIAARPWDHVSQVRTPSNTRCISRANGLHCSIRNSSVSVDVLSSNRGRFGAM